MRWTPELDRSIRRMQAGLTVVMILSGTAAVLFAVRLVLIVCEACR